ncbi:hypothetical protein AXG93_4421s1030 [Marchantia polymorpha subsp. ruderalis]|uniref:Uncharacterized protein n=1 Tax=Marchantia polymorpha subsp. ruderalis TaxID=1480154 RepID=A0A176WHZ4_MARPO|nr:hypothetical protein AXG93_4421s1030 [Marchantia polymorpha subsp. ruderalis]
MAFEERETGEGNARWKVEDAQQKIRELIPEMRYQKELNFSLTAQVRKTQDSNMELVLAINDVEESLEESRLEVEALKTDKHRLEEDLQQEKYWKQKFNSLQEKIAEKSPPFSKDGYEVRIKGLKIMVERLTQDVEDLENRSQGTYKRECGVDLPGSDATSMELLVVELKSKLAASEDNLRSMLESNDTSVVGMQRSVAELRTANDNLQKQLKESRNEAEQARRQAEDANLRSVSLRNSGDTATRSNAELERSLADVRAALESREKELAVLEERYSRAEVERSISLEKAAVLEDERRLLEGDIRSVTNAKALWEGRCSTLRREKEELEHSLQKARQEIVENRDLELEVSAGKEEISALNLVIRNFDERFLKLEKELFNADTEKSDLRKLIEAGEDREKLLK